MTNAIFRRALSLFPIRSQQELDLAVLLLRQVPKKVRGQANFAFPRARALLSYAMLTARLDGWAAKDVTFWGNYAAFKPAKVPKRALRTAQKALALQLDPATGDPQFTYDVRWAFAFANLCSDDYTTAEAQFRAALNENLTGDATIGKRFRDINLVAEAADAFVYLGRVRGAAPNARSLVTDAFADAQAKWGEVPDWFLWTRAWVSFAEAALQTTDAARIPLLNAAIADLTAILPDDPEVPSDFDAYALLAVATFKLGQANKARDIWNSYLDEARTKRRLDWDASEEKDRSRFSNLAGAPDAATVKTYWESGVDAVDG